MPMLLRKASTTWQNQPVIFSKQSFKANPLISTSNHHLLLLKNNLAILDSDPSPFNKPSDAHLSTDILLRITSMQIQLLGSSTQTFC